MKIRSLLALAGLAIGFAVPIFAQQKDTAPDPQVRQQVVAIAKAYDEATNRHDPAAIAAIFTEDADFVTDRGPIHGRQAIEKWYTDLFKGWQHKNHLSTFDPDCPHLIGTAGDTLWETGGWSETGQGLSGEPIPIKGYWGAVKVRQGEDWKIRMMTVNVTRAPAATPSTR
jgi:ketosteroid isomerase-like protein